MKYEDFVHMSVAGDGACFFHSLSKILSLEGTNQSATSLRKQCVDWLKNNLNYQIKGLGLTIKDEIEEEIRTNNKLKSVNDYLNYMRKRDAYAGQIEIYAMANLFNRNIRVYIRNKGKFGNVGLGYQINGKQDMMKDIFLYHNMGTTLSPGLHHFEPLYPKVKVKESKKKESKKKESKKKESKKRTLRKTNSTRKTSRQAIRKSTKRSSRISTRKAIRKSTKRSSRISTRKAIRKSTKRSSRKEKIKTRR